MTNPLTPTTDPEINALLGEILHGAQQALGEKFAGMYLHGSLALGDFTPGRSDIDYVVVTEGELTAAETAALAAMHARINAAGGTWIEHLEGSYIPRDALRRFDPQNSLFPALRTGGEFGIDYHGSAWVILRHVLREHGVALYGPPARTLVDPITPEALRSAAAGTLREWWAPQLDDPSLLRAPEYQAYAVLTMCRSLYTMETGDVASKPAAARWALAGPAAHLSSLIEQAMAYRNGDPFDRLDEVLDFVRDTLARTGQQEET